MTKQVKSKQRVADHGEVFTAEREVNAMLDLVKEETERIDSRFLEPACGDGNFLAEILRRKLDVVKRVYGKDSFDYERYSVLAVTSIYGVDLLQDNVEACRERLYDIWNKEYTKLCKKDANEDCRQSVRFILKRNILCGNALSLREVDLLGEDTEIPIIFSQWDFVTAFQIKRQDFRFDVLLKEHEDEGCYSQYSLFGDDALGQENWMIDPDTNEPTPKPVADYPPIHYRRLFENE